MIYFSGIQGFYKEYGRNPQGWYREHRDSIGIPQGSVGECNILLQCVKCAIRHDLLYREPGPSSILEAEINNDGDDGGDSDGINSDDDGEGSEVEGWDDLLLEEEEDDSLTAEMDTDVD